jgi:hypothetical protein
MKTFDFDQGTAEWLSARRGVITASESAPFIHGSGKVAEAARQKYIDRKVAELSGHHEESAFVNDAMKRGTALESIARLEYERMIDCTVKEIGFVKRENSEVGCSPDGLVYDGKALAGGVEIKCPSGATQIRYLREGILPPEYVYQVHHSMAVLDVDWYDFFSFCPLVTRWTKTKEKWDVDDWEPGLIPSFSIRVYRDKFTDTLSEALEDVAAEIQTQLAWLNRL